ncbi:glycerophosphodiester phosphodiesterase family protein [Novosphingobium sp. 9]|uniref:glycerophosphodiester phosphodiesterase family protein n=1 Tax=Novosphingobium sp. 9 TaxID=2025349 RepID=UPI0021B6D8A9|nr:glycerophosphodiester phosphodiesterase family protein [Novosphingobium sp. 9]
MPSLPFALLDRWLAPVPPPSRVDWIGAQDFAHRGLHDAGVPENSRAAFARAVSAGVGIELDVQRSSDGRAVVFHDDTLERLTGDSGRASRRTAQQLGALTLAGTSETIPTLRDVLAEVAGRVPVLIEVKVGPQQRVAAICLAVRRVLEGYVGEHAVMSFDPRVCAWFRRHSSHTVRGLIVSEGDDRALAGKIRRRLSLWHARPDFLAYDIRDLPSRFAAAQRRRGMMLATWTVRTPDHRDRALDHADTDIFEGEVVRRQEVGVTA